MKTWLIRLGKVWSLLKRDGFWHGLERVFSMAGVLFQPIGTGDILFISGGAGDSARYRTRHVAEELRLRGFRTAATIQDHSGLLAAVERFQIFVLHRTLLTPELKLVIDRVKELKKTLIFETDDLVYDPDFLQHMDYYQQMNALERKLYEHGVGGEILNDPYVEVATTTTSFLAEKLREKGKRVFIVSNKLSQEDLAWAQQALDEKKKNQDVRQKIRIGYLSGTLSHNKDFATITGALLRVLDRYPQVELVLAGPLDTDDALQQYADRVVRLPFVARSELFGNIASLDINLAPLEIGNPFCESKSELKWFEAGIVEVPTVAAATRTFREAITDGVDGFIAATEEEWYDRVQRLIEDGMLRETLGKKARESVLSRYSTLHAKNETYDSFIRSHLLS